MGGSGKLIICTQAVRFPEPRIFITKAQCFALISHDSDSNVTQVLKKMALFSFGAGTPFGRKSPDSRLDLFWE